METVGSEDDKYAGGSGVQERGERLVSRLRYREDSILSHFPATTEAKETVPLEDDMNKASLTRDGA